MVKIVDLTKHVKINFPNNRKLKDPKDKYNNNKHYSVGAIIKKNNKYLMINRNLFPPGYACIAGHIQKREKPIQALRREVKEETNYDIISKNLLFHEVIESNGCRSGVNIHEWYLYECKCNGKLKKAPIEEKSIAYLTKKEINILHKQNKLEPVWEYWFKKLKIINGK